MLKFIQMLFGVSAIKENVAANHRDKIKYYYGQMESMKREWSSWEKVDVVSADYLEFGAECVKRAKYKRNIKELIEIESDLEIQTEQMAWSMVALGHLGKRKPEPKWSAD